jgi:uncharacterized membrane protein
MEKLVTILLNNEEKAFKASQDIVNLGKQGDIKINEIFILKKSEAGELQIFDVKGEKIPYLASVGMIGGIFGLLGGPLGVFFGMTTGLIAGGIGDFLRISRTKRFFDKASKAMPNDKIGIVANVIESWETPLNSTLKPFTAEIKRLDINEVLERFVNSEQLLLQKRIEVLEREIEVDEDKDKLKQELESIKLAYTGFQKETAEVNNSSKESFSQWMDKVKVNLVKFKDNIADYFDEDKEDLIEEYNDLKEDYLELSIKINSNLKKLDSMDDSTFKNSIGYLKSEIEEFDEDINALEVQIEGLEISDNLRWVAKIEKLKTKRIALIDKAKAQLTNYTKKQQEWINTTSQNFTNIQ